MQPSKLSSGSIISINSLLFMILLDVVRGTFCRFTFLIFSFPVGVSAFITLLRENRLSIKRLESKFRPSIVLAVCSLLSYVAYDSYYYSRGSRSAFPPQSSFTPPPQVWTPYNALRYNLQSANLAEHGVHPRWLHLVVNAPMLFGIPLVGFLLYRLVDFFIFSRQGREGHPASEAVPSNVTPASTKDEKSSDLTKKSDKFHSSTRELESYHPRSFECLHERSSADSILASPCLSSRQFPCCPCFSLWLSYQSSLIKSQDSFFPCLCQRS